MGAIRTVRHWSPPIRRRIVAPNFWPLRPVLMPWPRLEKAELFVVHLVHFAEKLDHDAVGVPVIDRDIVPDDVAERSPGELDVALGQEIAGAFDVGPVAHLESDVMNGGLGVTEKIHGVMIAAAAQKGEEIAAPVGNAKTQKIAIELHHARDVRTGIGNVAKFERHNAGESPVVGSEGAVREDFERGALGILERQRFANAGRDVVAPLALDAGLAQPRGDRVKIASGSDLQRQPRRFAGVAALETRSLPARIWWREWRGPCRGRPGSVRQYG